MTDTQGDREEGELSDQEDRIAPPGRKTSQALGEQSSGLY